MRVLCLLLLTALSIPAAAEVYRYVDEHGVVHYTDTPPTKNARPAVLPPLHTYPAGEPPEAPADEPEAPAETGAGGFRLSIDAPAPETVFRDPSGTVSVSASVAPPPGAGFRYQYYVDGAAASPEPLSSPGFTITGLERGSHQIAVALIDPSGREISRSPAVTVHLKPPAVRPRAPARAR
jgi:hypothetical protein